MTTPADERARRRALAEKATPGPWTAKDHAVCVGGRWTGLFKHPDAAYIAALSPDVVLALLDAADRAEAAERDARRYRAMKEYDAKRFHDDLDFDAQADALIADLASGKPVAPLAEGRQSILDERDALRQECERLRELLRHVQITLGVIKGGLSHYTEARGVLESCIGKIRAALADPAPDTERAKGGA